MNHLTEFEDDDTDPVELFYAALVAFWIVIGFLTAIALIKLIIK